MGLRILHRQSGKGAVVPHVLDSFVLCMRTLRPEECGGDDCIRSYNSAEVGRRQESSSQITIKGYVTIIELKLPGTHARFPWQPYGTNHPLWVALTHSLYGFYFSLREDTFAYTLHLSKWTHS